MEIPKVTVGLLLKYVGVSETSSAGRFTLKDYVGDLDFEVADPDGNVKKHFLNKVAERFPDLVVPNPVNTWVGFTYPDFKRRFGLSFLQAMVEYQKVWVKPRLDYKNVSLDVALEGEETTPFVVRDPEKKRHKMLNAFYTGGEFVQRNGVLDFRWPAKVAVMTPRLLEIIDKICERANDNDFQFEGEIKEKIIHPSSSSFPQAQRNVLEYDGKEEPSDLDYDSFLSGMSCDEIYARYRGRYTDLSQAQRKALSYGKFSNLSTTKKSKLSGAAPKGTSQEPMDAIPIQEFCELFSKNLKVIGVPMDTRQAARLLVSYYGQTLYSEGKVLWTGNQDKGRTNDGEIIY